MDCGNRGENWKEKWQQAGVSVKRGAFCRPLPAIVVDFFSYLRIESKCVMGVGASRGARWLLEIALDEPNLLDSVIAFGAYPFYKLDFTQQQDQAMQLMRSQIPICLVHYDGDAWGPIRFGNWHGTFKMGMTLPSSVELQYGRRVPQFFSVTLQGTHDDAVADAVSWNFSRYPNQTPALWLHNCKKYRVGAPRLFQLSGS